MEARELRRAALRRQKSWRALTILHETCQAGKCGFSMNPGEGLACHPGGVNVLMYCVTGNGSFGIDTQKVIF
jgi:hypothetical protein